MRSGRFHRLRVPTALTYLPATLLNRLVQAANALSVEQLTMRRFEVQVRNRLFELFRQRP